MLYSFRKQKQYYFSLLFRFLLLCATDFRIRGHLITITKGTFSYSGRSPVLRRASCPVSVLVPDTTLFEILWKMIIIYVFCSQVSQMLASPKPGLIILSWHSPELIFRGRRIDSWICAKNTGNNQISSIFPESMITTALLHPVMGSTMELVISYHMKVPPVIFPFQKVEQFANKDGVTLPLPFRQFMWDFFFHLTVPSVPFHYTIIFWHFVQKLFDFIIPVIFVTL